MLSDALESVVNILASIIMFSSVCISEQNPNENYRYGHQKMENISSLLEGMLIVFASLWILKSAYGRVFTPVRLLNLNIAVMRALGPV
jgi:divalent metal cation (Fe/Co/Zn/Cd) transporter